MKIEEIALKLSENEKNIPSYFQQSVLLRKALVKLNVFADKYGL